MIQALCSLIHVQWFPTSLLSFHAWKTLIFIVRTRLKAIVTIADTWGVSGTLNVFNTELSAYNNYEVGAIIISVNR